MSFENNIKVITPNISLIKNNTPVIKIGDKYFVGGIGGNFIPGNSGTDVSDTTAIASDVLLGKYFYKADGIKTCGTLDLDEANFLYALIFG